MKRWTRAKSTWSTIRRGWIRSISTRRWPSCGASSATSTASLTSSGAPRWVSPKPERSGSRSSTTGRITGCAWRRASIPTLRSSTTVYRPDRPRSSKRRTSSTASAAWPGVKQTNSQSSTWPATNRPTTTTAECTLWPSPRHWPSGETPRASSLTPPGYAPISSTVSVGTGSVPSPCWTPIWSVTIHRPQWRSLSTATVAAAMPDWTGTGIWPNVAAIAAGGTTGSALIFRNRFLRRMMLGCAGSASPTWNTKAADPSSDPSSFKFIAWRSPAESWNWMVVIDDLAIGSIGMTGFGSLWCV